MCDPLTSPRRRQVPKLCMTSSARSEWSESHTSPMDTISGEFISTRRIRNTSPQLLCDGKREEEEVKDESVIKQVYSSCVMRHKCDSGGAFIWQR